jgi:hypothetical protein
VIAEQADAARVVQPRFGAERRAQLCIHHGRRVVVAEAQVGADEQRIARCHRVGARHCRVPGDDLLGQGERTRRVARKGKPNAAAAALGGIRSEAAGEHDRAAQGVERAHELVEQDGVARCQAVEQ